MVNRKVLKNAIIAYSLILLGIGVVLYIGLSILSNQNPNGDFESSYARGMGAVIAIELFFFFRSLRGKNGKVRFELED